MTSDDVRRKHDAHLFPSQATYYDAPVVLESGRGMHVRDLDGREYLDFFGGILTISVGHCNDRVNERVIAQIRRLGHVSTLYPTLPVVELAEKLARIGPGKLDKAFFTASGTEANETAIALAQLHTKNQEIIALRHGYSGRSMMAQSLAGVSKYRVLQTQVAAIKHAHAPYCYRCPFGLEHPSCELRCARDIEELIQTTTSGAIAGFLAEPIQGLGGFIDAPDGYFQVAVEIIRRYGGVFICDEVQTGFGRTGGKMWGIEHHGVEPEIVTMAKGIANGLPLGATLTTTAIASAWRGGNISTFGGNPVSAAAACATIDVIEDEGLPANAASVGAALRAGLDELKRKYPRTVGDVRGRGLMLGVELVRDESAGDRTPAPEKVARFFEETRARGLLVGRGGLYANVIRVAPPLVATRGDVETALRIMDEALAAIRG